MKTANQFRTAAHASVIITALIAIALLCSAAYYCPPNAEDFALSNAPRFQGELTSVINLLTFFDSRYTANLLHAFNPLVWELYSSFYIIPIFCLSIFIIAVRFFLGSMFIVKNSENKYILWIYTLLFTAAYFAVTPSLPFALYYMSSTFTYTYPCIFWMLWMGCLMRGYENEGLKHVVLNVVGLVFLILSFGSSELFIVVNGLSLFAVLLFCFPNHKIRFYTALPYFITGLACLFFIFNMPSQKFTADRMFNNLDMRYPETNFLTEGLKQFGSSWMKVFLTPFVLVSLLSSAVILGRLTFRQSFFNNSKWKGLAVRLSYFQFIAFMLTVPYFIARGSIYDYPVYVLNISVFIAILGCFIFIPQLVSQKSYLKNYPSASKTILGLLVVAAPLSLVLGESNYRYILSDFRTGKLQQIHALQQQFYKEVDSVKQQTQRPWVVMLPQPENPPLSVWLDGDLLPNRENEDWNLAYEIYFKIDELRLPGDTIYITKNNYATFPHN